MRSAMRRAISSPSMAQGPAIRKNWLESAWRMPGIRCSMLVSQFGHKFNTHQLDFFIGILVRSQLPEGLVDGIDLRPAEIVEHFILAVFIDNLIHEIPKVKFRAGIDDG